MAPGSIRLLTLVAVTAVLWLPAATSSAATVTVDIGNFFFRATNITVAVMDTVVWTNRSFTVHDTTQGTDNTPDNERLWISPNIPANGSYRWTFTNAGFHPYVCLQHIAGRPEQTGTVTVLAPVPLRLAAPSLNESGQFQFEINTAPGQRFVFETTTNLAGSWSPFATNTAAGTTLRVTHPVSAIESPKRFFRALKQP